MSDKKFGLIIPKRPDKLKMRTNSIFDDESDEDEKQRKRPKIPQKKIDIKSKIMKESQEDPSIYEYDSIYDDMKAKQAESIAPKEKKSSRYIDTLLKAADKRKKQLERRIDKKIQAEREKEGDLYKDKEAFVTSSYKKKLQEKEEEEERERRENMLNDMMDITKQKDLSGFYRHFLKQTVGEEKVPVFGAKHIKQEPTASEESNCSSRVSENTKDNVNLDQANIDQDSDGVDIDSDSDDKNSNTSEESCSKKHAYKSSVKSNDTEEKSQKSESRKHNVSKDKSKFKSQEKDQKTHCQNDSNVSNSDSEPSSDEDVRCTEKDSPSDVHRSKKKNIHRHDSLSSDDTEGDKKSDEPKEQNKVTKDKTSIYTKRTVGDAFVAAQARYFQRVSVKNEK